LPRYRREAVLDPALSPGTPDRKDVELRFADVLLNLSRREAYRADALLRLTLLEYELLTFLVGNPYQAFTRQQLRGEVSGRRQDDEQSNSVDVAIMGLRKKLEAGGRSRLIQTLRGYGYALREDA
jgi:two-component system, OmpR family, response regulator MprA